MKFFFSIITVCYNAEDTISNTFNSVKLQEFVDYEHIIIDGKSSDKTLEVIEDYAINNKNVTYLSEHDNGIYFAMNKGLSLAKGDYIIFLHSDDVFVNNNVLYEISQTISKKNYPDVLNGNILYCNKKQSVIRYWKSSVYKPYKLYFGWMPPHPGFICSRHVYEKFKFNTKYSISSDYDFMIRVLKSRLYDIQYINIDIMAMTTGGVSNKISNWPKKMKEDSSIIISNKLIPLLTLIFKNISKLHQFFWK